MRILSAILAGLLLLTAPTPVAAETLVLTSSQIDLITGYCTPARGHLERLHSADALLRVNLGQRYENISTKLMAPLNSRVALAGNDGVDMVKTTVDFNEELTTFRELYLDYDNQMADVISMKCQDKPVEFYQQLEIARQKRTELNESVVKLGELIVQYKTQFEEFAQKTIDEDNK